jgi:hypothetical protein
VATFESSLGCKIFKGFTYVDLKISGLAQTLEKFRNQLSRNGATFQQNNQDWQNKPNFEKKLKNSGDLNNVNCGIRV